MARTLTYGDFYSTGVQDARNAFSVGDVDMDAGETAEEILAAFIDDPEAFQKEWHKQHPKRELEGLAQARCYDEWFKGWSEVALSEIRAEIPKHKQRKLNGMEQWYLDVGEDVDDSVRHEKLLKLLREKAQISLRAEQDDTEVRGNALASGNDREDREAENDIIDRLNDGDVWAWAHVTVYASYDGLQGRDALGACSYGNETEFRADPYFAEMTERAIENLAEHMERLGRAQVMYDDAEIVEQYPDLFEAITALAGVPSGRILYGDGNGPDMDIVYVDRGSNALRWVGYPSESRPSTMTTFGLPSSSHSISNVDINAATRIFGEKRAELVRRGMKFNPGRLFRPQKVVAMLQRETRPGFESRTISSPTDVLAGLVDHMGGRATELFLVLFLNVRNGLVGYTEIGEGGVASVNVDVSGIMREALACGAAAFVTVHNHPTDISHPSAQDEGLWARLKEAGNLVGVPVVDNMIVGSTTYYSQSEGFAQRLPARVLEQLAKRRHDAKEGAL